MSSGEAADFAAGAGATFTASVAAAVGAVAALAGVVAGFVSAGDDVDFVSTVLPIAGVAATDGTAFVAAGEITGTIGAALDTGAFLSVTASGAFGGPAQPEINSANNVAVRPGTIIEIILVQDISSPICIKQCQVDIIGGNLRPNFRAPNMIVNSKYPPAKPWALGCEPLKAAWRKFKWVNVNCF